MSAPPLDNPSTMPTMVSRLPKFGSRPKSDSPSNGAQVGLPPTASSFTSTRLTNGFYHHPGPAGVNGSLNAPPASLKQNGFLRVPTSFSMKWRKENETSEDGEQQGKQGKGGNIGQNFSLDNNHQYYPQRQQTSPVLSQKGVKKPTTAPAGKGRGFGLPVTSSASAQAGTRTLPVSKTASLGSKPSRAALGQINGTKQTLNGHPGSKLRNGVQIGSLKMPQTSTHPAGTRPGSGPASRSGSPLQKKQPANRSHSSDSLGSAPPVQLNESDRFRSRSLTQVRRQPSPNLTRSSSSSLCRSSAKSPVKSGGRAQGISSTARTGVRIPSLMPPTALKKPLLLSNGLASKPSGISYKLSRPSLIKQSRPLRVTTANEQGDDQEGKQKQIQSPSTSETSPETSPEAPETEGLSADPVSQGGVSVVGETLEDMSLSSSSSLDRNDMSQEYMDDFDNLGIGGVGILLFSSKNDEDDSGLDQSCARFDEDKPAVNGVTKTPGLCFLDDAVDWTGMRLNGERGENRLTRLNHRRRTSQPEYHEQGGSSLDLSPSDSCGSGGTYMWDEEGLEPLGSAVTTASIHTNSNTTHHIGSFDSDLNSIDILNNLESCDLDDDDLMLDADVPEDISLHSDGDGISHMAEWRRRQLCWGTQDVHNDNETDFQCYKLTEDPGNKRTDLTRDGDLILELCPQRSPFLFPGSPGIGLDVEELAEDCSAVRSQLEYLQRLLLQEEDADDDTLTTDTLSPENDSSQSSDNQVQTLLQEVQQLREELRSRDRTIAQLTKQLTVPMATSRCHCQETSGKMDRHTQTSVMERESATSQTPWREHTSQILHSSSQDDQKPLTDTCSALPPTQAPAPDNSSSTHPDNRPPITTEEGGKDDKKPVKKEENSDTKEKKGTYNRSLQLPQPSKLRPFLPHTSNSAASTPPKTKVARQLCIDSESNSTVGVKVKMSALHSGLSRLPKPKSH